MFEEDHIIIESPSHREPSHESHPFRIFCGGHFEFLIRGLLVRSVEPKLRKSGTGGKIRKFSEAADRSPRIILRAPNRLRAISVISVPDLCLRCRLTSSVYKMLSVRIKTQSRRFQISPV